MPLDKEADRERKRKKRAEAKQEKVKQEQEQVKKEVPKPKIVDKPTIDDAADAYGDQDKEDAISALIMRRYMKSCTWAFIIYPDSAPADFEDKLRMQGIPFAFSPLHDKDLSDKRDEHGKRIPKKSHRHGMIYNPNGSMSFKTACAISKDLLHGTIPVPLVSPRGYYRYFTHLDNPNKAQYDKQDIITGNGFDIGDFLELTAQEKNDLAKQIIAEIINQGMTEYWELVTYSMFNMDAAAFEFVRTNTLFLRSALQSKRFMEWGQPEDSRSRMGKPYPNPLGSMTKISSPARPDQSDQGQQIAQKDGGSE